MFTDTVVRSVLSPVSLRWDFSKQGLVSLNFNRLHQANYRSYENMIYTIR